MREHTPHRNHIRHPRLVDTVAALLQQSGMTQAQMMERWQVGRSFLTELNNGKANPSADSMQRIYEDLTGRPLINEFALRG